MYEVLVSGLEITGHHGVTEMEQTKGCRLKIDVSAEVSGTAHESDRLSDTVDYGELSALIEDVSDSARFKTLERLAKAIADRGFSRFPLMEAIEVRIDKLDPPVPQTVGSLGVRYTAHRPG